jgi:hypothetical protein
VELPVATSEASAPKLRYVLVAFVERMEEPQRKRLLTLEDKPQQSGMLPKNTKK